MNVAILVRVSSKGDRQDTERQINDLTKIANEKKWNIVKVIKAKVSATKTRINNRKDIAEIYDLANAKKIDKVLVTEITRIGRKAKEIRDTIEDLRDKNVGVFIQTLHIDTLLQDDGTQSELQKKMSEMAVNIILTILGELAEVEALRLSNRILSGLETAKKNGVILGRPEGSKLKNNDFIKKHSKVVRKLNEGKMSIREIAKICEVSPFTVQKAKKILKAVQNI